RGRDLPRLVSLGLEVDVPVAAGEPEIGPVPVLAARDVGTALSGLRPSEHDLRAGDRLAGRALHGSFDAGLAPPLLSGKRRGGEDENQTGDRGEALEHRSPPKKESDEIPSIFPPPPGV